VKGIALKKTGVFSLDGLKGEKARTLRNCTWPAGETQRNRRIMRFAKRVFKQDSMGRQGHASNPLKLSPSGRTNGISAKAGIGDTSADSDDMEN